MICSIIVLNYFGEKVIAKVLDSLLALDYPKNNYEIIVVDNASTDKSPDIIKDYAKKHHLVKNIFLTKNYGFSGGNNFGIKAASGKYVVLLNNDCIVDPNWLKNIIKVAEKNNQIFAVNSKILLYPKYLNFVFELHPGLTFLYCWLSKSALYQYEEDKNKKVYLAPIKFGSKKKLEILFDPIADSTVEITLYLGTKKTLSREKIRVTEMISLPESFVKITSFEIRDKEIELRISIDTRSPQARKVTQDKVQNAGIIVFQNGYGRDIGAVINAQRQYYEYDKGQYQIEKNIYAACAAAVLYRRSIFEKIGYMDESFFMYYEDVELAERARFNGYQIVYCPEAIVRHYHSLSSKEWSPFFIYHAEKGRLLHVFYNFPIVVFVSEYIKLVFKSVISLLSLPSRWKFFINDVKDRKSHNILPEYNKRVQIVKILFYFIISFPYLLAKRIGKQRNINKNAVRNNYKAILKGDWYLK